MGITEQRKMYNQTCQYEYQSCVHKWHGTVQGMGFSVVTSQKSQPNADSVIIVIFQMNTKIQITVVNSQQDLYSQIIGYKNDWCLLKQFEGEIENPHCSDTEIHRQVHQKPTEIKGRLQDNKRGNECYCSNDIVINSVHL